MVKVFHFFLSDTTYIYIYVVSYIYTYIYICSIRQKKLKKFNHFFKLLPQNTIKLQ